MREKYKLKLCKHRIVRGNRQNESVRRKESRGRTVKQLRQPNNNLKNEGRRNLEKLHEQSSNFHQFEARKKKSEFRFPGKPGTAVQNNDSGSTMKSTNKVSCTKGDQGQELIRGLRGKQTAIHADSLHKRGNKY